MQVGPNEFASYQTNATYEEAVAPAMAYPAQPHNYSGFEVEAGRYDEYDARAEKRASARAWGIGTGIAGGLAASAGYVAGIVVLALHKRSQVVASPAANYVGQALGRR